MLVIFFLMLLCFLLRLFLVLVCFFVVLARGFFGLFGALLSFALAFFDGLLTLLFGAFGIFSLFGGGLGFGFVCLPFSFGHSAWAFLFVPALSGEPRADFVPVEVLPRVTHFEDHAAFRHRADQFSTCFLGRRWHDPPELFRRPSCTLIERGARRFAATVDRDPHFGFGRSSRAALLRCAGGRRRRRLAGAPEGDRASGHNRHSDQQAGDQSSAPRLYEKPPERLHIRRAPRLCEEYRRPGGTT